MAERNPPAPNPDREIPYLLCRQCGTPTYIFEIEDGQVSEALCVTCGNETVSLFTIADWDDVIG